MSLIKRVERAGGAHESDRIGYVSNDSIEISAIKSLDDLSQELSQFYSKNVVVVDILEEDATERKVHSLVTGKTFDDLLHNYEFDKKGYSQISADYLRGFNKDKGIMENYRISLVFKEE